MYVSIGANLPDGRHNNDLPLAPFVKNNSTFAGGIL